MKLVSGLHTQLQTFLLISKHEQTLSRGGILGFNNVSNALIGIQVFSMSPLNSKNDHESRDIKVGHTRVSEFQGLT